MHIDFVCDHEFVTCFRFLPRDALSAKRGIAIACRLSVCLSVCNVGEL